MYAAKEFMTILHNGSRKPMQKAKLQPFLKRKHSSVVASLKMIADLRWKG